MVINCQEIADSLAISALNTIRILLFISPIHMMLLCTEYMNAAENLSFKTPEQTAGMKTA